MDDTPPPTQCIVETRGVPCARRSVPTAPFPVCTHHMSKLYEFVVDNIKQRSPQLDIDHERALLASERFGVIYYVRCGELLKIGTTTQVLGQRLNQMPPDRQVLATEPGGYTLERHRHTQWRHRRAQGREWYHLAPDLLDHIRALRDEHGEPDEWAPVLSRTREAS